MISKFGKWFMALSRIAKVGVVAVTMFALVIIGSSTSGSKSTVNLNSANSSAQAKETVVHKKEVKTVDIPFMTSTVGTDALEKSKTRVQVEGVNGVRTYTYDVTYTNGVETSRVELSNEVTTEPVNEVISVGTHDSASDLNCPAGTYVNTYGSTVCRPYTASSVPAGATARCADGTYSFSQSRSGTCSHHGGAASWL